MNGKTIGFDFFFGASWLGGGFDELLSSTLILGNLIQFDLTNMFQSNPGFYFSWDKKLQSYMGI